jgi:hypothetical protein
LQFELGCSVRHVVFAVTWFDTSRPSDVYSQHRCATMGSNTVQHHP